VGDGRFRYEAILGPDGRIQSLVHHAGGLRPRPIRPESPEGLTILAGGGDILYRFDDERRLADMAYPDVLEAMRQEIHLTLHKVRHGELLDEPELVPVLRRLLADLEATAAAFRDACARLRAGA